MSFPKVYVIILNWNGKDDTAECLDSVLKMSYPNLQVVVVDNGSSDGSVEAFESRFPEVEVISIGENIGFSAGNNKGMQYAVERGADYVFVLNNDTVVHQDLLTHMVSAAEADQKVGITAPKIYYYAAGDLIWAAGAKRSRFDLGALETGMEQKDGPAYNIEKEVDYAFGCGMLIRRQVLEQVGLFDTRFFFYFEDTDLCIRTQQHGYKIVYVPQAKMWHKVAVSSKSKRYSYIWGKSKMLFYRKHTRDLHLAALVMYSLGHALLRAVSPRSYGGVKGSLWFYLRGLFDGLRQPVENETIRKATF
jgi:GT2 family glycosyltransferase